MFDLAVCCLRQRRQGLTVALELELVIKCSLANQTRYVIKVSFEVLARNSYVTEQCVQRDFRSLTGEVPYVQSVAINLGVL